MIDNYSIISNLIEFNRDYTINLYAYFLTNHTINFNILNLILLTFS